MQYEPDTLTRDTIIEALRQHWGIEAKTLTYAPLGFGSHHWVATCSDDTRRFLTADHLPEASTQEGESADEHFEGLRDAFETARTLRDDGLEFVLAPEPAQTGHVIARIDNAWSLAVFPFIEGAPLGPGPWNGLNSAIDAARLVGRLHSATPPLSLQRWRPDIPWRRVLMAALDALDAPWPGGPYAEPTRALLTAELMHIEAALAHHDHLAAQVMASAEPWVVTHGEPHSANFLRATSGETYLIDWDTVRIAPRERDLELGEGHAFEAYREIAKPPSLRAEAQELFRLRWSLADICVYVRLFRNDHGKTIDEARSWHYLQSEVARLGSKE